MAAIPRLLRPSLAGRILAGAALGLAVAAVDHAALGGGISSVFVVGLVLTSTMGFAVTWGWAAWLAVGALWTCVVLTHLAKHQFGLPGTLQPDTWDSIRSMAVFTLAVCGAGLCGGVLLRMAASD